MLISFRRHLRGLAAALLLLPPGLVLLYRFVPPPVTPLMLLRQAEGTERDQRWVGLEQISPDLLRAVIAAEDGNFCRHHGFDWGAIGSALDSYESGKRLRGGSTISQQTAKNLFLWPGRNFLRKGLEAGFTLLIETLWSKRRILEVYLNIVEWGPGLYGAEAAAQRGFHKPAAALTRSEAAALAVVLPNPRHWSAAHPSAFVARRQQVIRRRLATVFLEPGRVCP